MVPAPVVLALISVACFLGLAHAAVTTPPLPFLRMTMAMAVVAIAVALMAPAEGGALLGPVLLSRLLANAPIPATVPELLERYAPADRR